MANPEHLAKIQQGVEAWNKWRRENPDIQPDLSRASLRYANLRFANLKNVYLQYANLRDTHLSYVAFIGAILSGADLSDADLGGANLSNADLGNADLWGANLSVTNLQNTDFSGAKIRKTVFWDTDLSQARGLDSVRHHGPSEISISTLHKSRGSIPEIFLRGCGLSDWEIETVKLYRQDLSLDQVTAILNRINELRTNPAIQFHSCFISYSSKNQAFAERLYTDLQSKGVRCWFAPENLKIGDKFRQQIDESIKHHDKLLLILSEQSISSPWVEVEVESAFERENRENRLVLFPVRIDDAVINCEQAWAASLRWMRQIGDFTGWNEHVAYQKAFARLLRDLKSEESHNKI